MTEPPTSVAIKKPPVLGRRSRLLVQVGCALLAGAPFVVNLSAYCDGRYLWRGHLADCFMLGLMLLAPATFLTVIIAPDIFVRHRGFKKVALCLVILLGTPVWYVWHAREGAYRLQGFVARIKALSRPEELQAWAEGQIVKRHPEVLSPQRLGIWYEWMHEPVAWTDYPESLRRILLKDPVADLCVPGEPAVGPNIRMEVPAGRLYLGFTNMFAGYPETDWLVTVSPGVCVQRRR